MRASNVELSVRETIFDSHLFTVQELSHYLRQAAKHRVVPTGFLSKGEKEWPLFSLEGATMTQSIQE
ncbi:MAG TPA: hypothetical protein PL001_09495 [Candidatus Kryptobacter bacterium]|nr:MAG: hypothetical protein B7Z63_02960 [Ignavibacteriae bacterium 37-53-5]HQT92243.1 hypothetical protein [Candidatus Kryptobacter bacterium]